MWAFRNRKTKEWLYGTDFNYTPPRQRLSKEKAKIFEYLDEAEDAEKRREIPSDLFELIEVELIPKVTITEKDIDDLKDFAKQVLEEPWRSQFMKAYDTALKTYLKR